MPASSSSTAKTKLRSCLPASREWHIRSSSRNGSERNEAVYASIVSASITIRLRAAPHLVRDARLEKQLRRRYPSGQGVQVVVHGPCGADTLGYLADRALAVVVAAAAAAAITGQVGILLAAPLRSPATSGTLQPGRSG